MATDNTREDDIRREMEEALTASWEHPRAPVGLSFNDLVNSINALYLRFNLPLDSTLCYPRYIEEEREFRYAVVYHSRGETSAEHVVEELADLIYTATALALSLGVPVDAVQRGLVGKVVGNNQKDHTTHHVVDGKITRRGR